MRSLLLIYKNGIKRSMVLIPGVLLVIALMGIAYFGGRGEGEKYAVSGIPVGVIDLDNTAVSKDMIAYMETTLNWKLVMADAASYEAAFDKLTSRLLDCKIAVIVEIPQGLQTGLLSGNIPEVEITVLNDYENEAYTKSYLNSYLQKARLLVQAAEGNEGKLKELLDQPPEENLTVSAVGGIPQNLKKVMDENGIALMIGFFTFIGYGYPMFMGMLIIEDKKNGTFKRIQASSVKPAVYIGGMALSNLTINLISVIGILVMLHVVGAESNIPKWLLALLMTAFLLFSIGFNLFVAFLTKNSFTFMTIGVGYIAITNILGGAYFPLGENVLKKFSVLTPQYYIMDIARGLAENPSYAYGTYLCILFLMVVLIYLVAAVVYARREN